MFANVFPYQKTDTADNYQQHNRNVDDRLRRIARDRSKFAAFRPHNIEPGIAERRHGMENRQPNSFGAVIYTKYGHHNKRADKFNQKYTFDYKSGQADYSAHVWRRNRIFHCFAAEQPDFFAGNNGKRHGYGNDAHAADLNQQ